MTKSQVSTSLCDRFSAIGLPNAWKKPIVDLVNRWVQCSGPEWTVARLKDLKVDLLRSWSGLKPISEGIKMRHGSPCGPFRPLWSLNSPKGRFKALSTLMCYTAFLSPLVTEKQRAKFVSSVTRDRVELAPSEAPLVDRMVSLARSHVKSENLSMRLSDPSYDLYPWSPSRRHPDIAGKTVPEVQEGKSPYDPLFFVAFSPIFLDCFRSSETMRKAVPPTLLEFVRQRQEIFHGLEAFGENRVQIRKDCVGKISFIQEPGFKLRAVANPIRIYQVAFEPLKDKLDQVLQGLPWCWVHNQANGVEKVRSALKQGKTVYSIDLSDATNNFPLGPQLQVLKGILHPDQAMDVIPLFEKVSQSPWLITNEKGQQETITWTVGQPLGLGPSFASFTLTHGLMIEGIWQDLSKKAKVGGEFPFAIVGDDVAIWNKDLARRYLNTLQSWSIPISESKTIVSNDVAEFCGKVITRDRVYPQLKYRMVSDDSFVDIARNLGPQSLSLFLPLQREVLDKIAPVPEFLGGLGWNPKGIPLESRILNPVSQALISRTLNKDESLSYEKGLSLSVRHHYQCNWLFGEAVSLVKGPPSRPEKACESVLHRVLAACQVRKERVSPKTKMDSSWSPTEKKLSRSRKTTLEQLLPLVRGRKDSTRDPGHER